MENFQVRKQKADTRTVPIVTTFFYICFFLFCEKYYFVRHSKSQMLLFWLSITCHQKWDRWARCFTRFAFMLRCAVFCFLSERSGPPSTNHAADRILRAPHSTFWTLSFFCCSLGVIVFFFGARRTYTGIFFFKETASVTWHWTHKPRVFPRKKNGARQHVLKAVRSIPRLAGSFHRSYANAAPIYPRCGSFALNVFVFVLIHTFLFLLRFFFLSTLNFFSLCYAFCFYLNALFLLTVCIKNVRTSIFVAITTRRVSAPHGRKRNLKEELRKMFPFLC